MVNRKYYYSKLSPALRHVLDQIVAKLKAYVSTIKIINTEVTVEQIADLFEVIDKDFPELFYLDIKRKPVEITSLGFVKIVKVSFVYCQTEIERIQAEIDNVLSHVLTKGLKYEPISERARVLHDFLIQNVTYHYNSHDPSDYSIVGPFLYGKAICEGYSKAYKYLCEFADMNCLIVSGKARNGRSGQIENHAWNILYIGEGNYAHIDATWNCNVVFVTMGTYPYYIISDEKISKDHFWDSSQTPHCVGRLYMTIPVIRSANELADYLQEKLMSGVTKIIFEVEKDFESTSELLELIQKIILKRSLSCVKSVQVSYIRVNHRVQCEFEVN